VAFWDASAIVAAVVLAARDGSWPEAAPRRSANGRLVGQQFVCCDERLATAASAAGFVVRQ
jgi:hypothetical protein